MSINYTPRTWVAAEVVTAALLNAEVRDPLTGIQAAWSSFTPTLTSWTLGNGTLTGFWLQIRKTVHFRGNLTVGSTTTFSGGPVFALPVTAVSALGRDPIGSTTLFDTSAPAWRHYPLIEASSTTCNPVNPDGSALSPTVPWTWATGDRIAFSGTYEAA